MHLRSLVIKNFRGLESIEVEFDNLVNVIVGPNAIGKTTVLEAIRLTKALLAPRTQHESQQALFALGAAVPYNPQRIFPEAIARDSSRAIEISCEYFMDDTDLANFQETCNKLRRRRLSARRECHSRIQATAFLCSRRRKGSFSSRK